MSSDPHDVTASMNEHNAAVRRQFALQASTFTDTGFAARGLDWIVDEVNPSSTDLMVDVAAGAAHLGRAFASRVAHVSALDLTPEMLELWAKEHPDLQPLGVKTLMKQFAAIQDEYTKTGQTLLKNFLRIAGLLE